MMFSKWCRGPLGTWYFWWIPKSWCYSGIHLFSSIASPMKWGANCPWGINPWDDCIFTYIYLITLPCWVTTHLLLCERKKDPCFQIFFGLSPWFKWEMIPFDLSIFFKWVGSTTNQGNLPFVPFCASGLDNLNFWYIPYRGGVNFWLLTPGFFCMHPIFVNIGRKLIWRIQISKKNCKIAVKKNHGLVGLIFHYRTL